MLLSLLAQATDSSGTGSGVNLDPAAAFLAVKALLIPGIATWVFKKWNVAKGAMDGTPNLLKGVLFILASLVVGSLATFVGQTVGADPNTWTESTVASLLGGLIGTLQVKAGIASAKEKAGISKSSDTRSTIR